MAGCVPRAGSPSPRASFRAARDCARGRHDAVDGMTSRRPRVGVGVLLVREGRVLLGRRLGAHGAGHWALPGGHLEFGETIEACAAREVLEETGLVIEAPRLGPVTNNVFAAEEQHYVTVFVIAAAPTGEPRVLEPKKCAQWQWFAWSHLPQPLFAPLASLVASGFDTTCLARGDDA